MDINNIGEVIESSAFGYEAEAYQNVDPEIGTVVTTETMNHYSIGVVVQVRHEPRDSSRIVTALKKTETELWQTQPQIFNEIRCVFGVMAVGHQSKDSDEFITTIPPQPPKLHTFVSKISSSEELQILSNPVILMRLLRLSSEDSIEIFMTILHRMFILIEDPSKQREEMLKIITNIGQYIDTPDKLIEIGRRVETWLKEQ